MHYSLMQPSIEVEGHSGSDATDDERHAVAHKVELQDGLGRQGRVQQVGRGLRRRVAFRNFLKVMLRMEER